jgi:hypothetical protein
MLSYSCTARLGALVSTVANAAALTSDQLDSDRIIEAAHDAVPHADHVSFVVADARMRPRERASSDPVALQLDVIQRALEDGPAFDRVTCPDVARVNDLRRETRWPRFAKVASHVTGVQSLLAVRMPLSDRSRAAFYFCADRCVGFDDEDVAASRLIATLAANCLDRRAAQVKADNLELALTSATTIGTAIGVLGAREGITRTEAFDRLRVASQNLHRKLHDIAAEVCDTGVLPEYGRQPEHRE